MMIKRKIAAALAALMIAAPLCTAPAVAAGADVGVLVDGEMYAGDTVLVTGTTFVSLRQFAYRIPGAEVSWNAKTRTAKVKAGGHSVSAHDGAGYIEADGKRIKCPEKVFVSGGCTYVPLRAVASAFGYKTKWVGDARLAVLAGTEDAVKTYGEDAVYWLSRIISAEAKGEPFEGKLAVGTVIMNRVASDEYPDTVWGVIFDKRCGVQFTPTANGTVYEEPDAESVRAAKLCLDGYRTPGGVMFFMNEKIAQSTWIKNNCVFVISIGNHDFYA